MRLIDADWIKDRNSFVPKNELHTVEEFLQILDEAPAIDAVPWEFLERYADYFCAAVFMPEFVREAKAFYQSTQRAMGGGNIDEQKDGENHGT